MLGLILIAKLQAAILKRANEESASRVPFYLYVDEFQNFTTDTFTSLLSESRKYGLGIHITNQYLAQLPDTIKDAVLGNVGTLLSFEVGAEDAEILTKEFEPMTVEDFLGLPRYHFYVKLMIDGKTSNAFSGMSLPPEKKSSLALLKEKIITLNRLRYASPRLLVEEKMKNDLN